METSQHIDPTFSRLIYLAATQRVQIPKQFERYIPQGRILNDVAKWGLEGFQAESNVELPHFRDMYTEGEKLSPDTGTPEEYRVRIAQIIDAAVNRGELGDVTITEKFRFYNRVSDFVVGNDALLAQEEHSLYQDTEESDGLVKWETGLDFIDKAIPEGVYQGLHILMGAPGTGKTSHFMLLMSELRRQKKANGLWYFSLETPIPMVRYRMTKLRQRTKFKKGDMIFGGHYTIDDVIERVKLDPDPERIILYDGPDVLSAGSDDGRRFVLENIYRELVQLKQMCKAVWVPSQPKRNEQGGMSLESVAESWAKAWYADTVTGIERVGGLTNEGAHRLKMTLFKNRFGPLANPVWYNMDYGNFEWETNEGPTGLNTEDWFGNTATQQDEGDY